jgi:hypothetical protein
MTGWMPFKPAVPWDCVTACLLHQASDDIHKVPSRCRKEACLSNLASSLKARIVREPIDIYFSFTVHAIRALSGQPVRLFYFQCRNVVLPYLTNPLSGVLIQAQPCL